MLNPVKYKVIIVFFPALLSIPNTGNIIDNDTIVIKKPTVTLIRLSISDCFLFCTFFNLNL